LNVRNANCEIALKMDICSNYIANTCRLKNHNCNHFSFLFKSTSRWTSFQTLTKQKVWLHLTWHDLLQQSILIPNSAIKNDVIMCSCPFSRETMMRKQGKHSGFTGKNYLLVRDF